MRRRTDVTTEDLGNGITRINEYDFVNLYLVEGESGACLVDAGAGVADMAAVVKTLTDKPLTVLATHAHADHVGGATWFPEVYLHPLDYKRGVSYAKAPARFYFLYCHRYKRKTHKVRWASAFQKDFTPAFLPLTDGQVFDLGGRTLTARLTPGHSPGSMSFVDSKTGAVFTGDNVNLMVTLHFPGGQTVKTWIDAAEKTLSLAGDHPIYGGHGDGRIPQKAIEEALILAKDVLKDGNGKGHKTLHRRGDAKYPVLFYKADRVL